MSGVDESRQPVLVGAAQWEDRDPDPLRGPSPLEVLAEVASAAAADAGSPDLGAIDTLALIPPAGWQVDNAPGALATALGIAPDLLVDTRNGGEVGVRAVNWLARRILDGESEVALLAGAHKMRTMELAARRGEGVSWADESEGEPHRLPTRRPGTTETEQMSGIREDERNVGLGAPPQIYPLFENALAHHFGRTLEEHMREVGRLFSRFTDVAAENPHAWFPTSRSAQELVTPTPSNRMVAFPYTKYLNAILHTDQSAALVLMSVGRARALGIPEDRWVYWWGGHQSAEEAWWASTRPDFATCPSMLDSHLGALEIAGCSLDDIDLIDFYSCFPAAVEMACRMLGLALDDDRGFTITGGLPYAGGPGSGYTLHSLATMLDRVRERPDARALITGNGFYLTKHAASVWSGTPRPGGVPLRHQPSSWSDGFERAPVEPVVRSGRGHVETFTVLHHRDGSPERLVALGRFDDGSRFMGTGACEPSEMSAIERDGLIGRAVEVVAEDGACRLDLA